MGEVPGLPLPAELLRSISIKLSVLADQLEELDPSTAGWLAQELYVFDKDLTGIVARIEAGPVEGGEESGG